jgi:hypothetical protein
MKISFTYNTAFRNKQSDIPDVYAEATDDGIGVCIPGDHGELFYMNRNEARMLAYALLSMIGDSYE